MSNSPTKHEISLGLMDLLSSDGTITQFALANFGSAATFYAAEDYDRLDGLQYPFVHGFCYSKSESESGVSYALVMEISVEREVDANNRFIHTQVNSVITEDIHGKIDTWVEMIKTQIREDLAMVGIQGTKGFEVTLITDETLPPQGQDDIRCMLNFDLQLKKCI